MAGLHNHVSSYADVEIADSIMEDSTVGSEKDSDIYPESRAFLDSPNRQQAMLAPRKCPWRLVAVGLACLNMLFAGLLVLRRPVADVSTEVSRTAVTSDFPAARGVIELQEVTFTGNTAFHENGTGYIPHPSPVQYFGEPNEEVDARWIDLAGSRDFLISETEARELWPNDYLVHWDEKVNGYPIGLDMFHTLHCINDIRKLFHPDYYPVSTLNKASQAKHRDHCLDQLRQYVMCAGDMTPYGTLYYSGIGYNYADSDVTHTCRNFEKLREWTSRRYHAGGELHMPDVEVWNS